MQENLFGANGRMTRSVYLPTFALVNLASLGIDGLGVDSASVSPEAASACRAIAMMFVLWTMYCIKAKRLHDAGRSAFMAALSVALVAASGLLAEIGRSVTTDGMSTAFLFAAIAIGGYILIAPPRPSGDAYGDDPRIGRASPFRSNRTDEVQPELEGMPPVIGHEQAGRNVNEHAGS